MVILTPIRGITDVVYRAAFARCFGGFERAVAPYIQPRRGHELRPAELRQVAPEMNQSLIAIPQVVTCTVRRSSVLKYQAVADLFFIPRCNGLNG
jgi:hypothetical protein